MKNKVKTSALIASIALFAASSLQAAPGTGNPRYKGWRVESDKEKKEEKVITPPAGPDVSGKWDAFVTANFIYYKVVQDGTDFAYTGNYSGGSLYTSVPQGEIASIGYDWTPGFQVGLGCSTGHDNWSLYAQYTFLRSSQNKSLKQDGTSATDFVGIVNPTAVSYYGSNYASNNPNGYSIEAMNARWKLNFNKIDLDLARDFYVSECLTIKPLAGLTGTWQTQTINTSAQQNSFVSGSTTITNPVFSNKQVMKAWGLGLRAGFDLGWYFTKEFSLQSKAAINAVWTDYNEISLRSSMLNPANSQSTTFVSQNNNNRYCANYIAELQLALCYEVYFNNNDNCFSCQVGWDAQTWVNWGRFIQSTDLVIGDLSLQGLNVQFRFDF